MAVWQLDDWSWTQQPIYSFICDSLEGDLNGSFNNPFFNTNFPYIVSPRHRNEHSSFAFEFDLYLID